MTEPAINPEFLIELRTAIAAAAAESMDNTPNPDAIRAHLAKSMGILIEATEQRVRVRTKTQISGIVLTAGGDPRTARPGEEIDMPLSMATRMIDLDAVEPLDLGAFTKTAQGTPAAQRVAAELQLAVERRRLTDAAKAKEAEIQAQLERDLRALAHEREDAATEAAGAEEDDEAEGDAATA